MRRTAAAPAENAADATPPPLAASSAGPAGEGAGGLVGSGRKLACGPFGWAGGAATSPEVAVGRAG